MPPKKRKATSTAQPTQGKRVRIGSSSVIGEDDGASVISATGRPKRSSAGAPSYDQTRRNSTTVKEEPKAKKAVDGPEPTKRGPGRPRKSVTPASASVPAPASPAPTKKLAGRPAKTATHVEIPKKRGSPPKKSPAPMSKPTAATKPAAAKPATQSTGKRGRPKRAVSGTVEELTEDSTVSVVQEAEWEDDSANPPGKWVGKALGGDMRDELHDDRQFWLMKAEPESRIEKGQDVKFSIDDLMSKTEPEGWDGVRNPVARNNMRAMRKGDMAFFYHSNCAIPGIAGLMQVVQEHSVDESAFDPKHPYYDPKSDRKKPKWELVHVVGVHKFVNLVTLKELKAHMGPGKPLENLQTLKQSRLSVSSVTGKEWNFIMNLSGEEFEEDEVQEQVEVGKPRLDTPKDFNRAISDDADTIATDQASGDAKDID